MRKLALINFAVLLTGGVLICFFLPWNVEVHYYDHGQSIEEKVEFYGWGPRHFGHRPPQPDKIVGTTMNGGYDYAYGDFSFNPSVFATEITILLVVVICLFYYGRAQPVGAVDEPRTIRVVRD